MLPRADFNTVDPRELENLTETQRKPIALALAQNTSAIIYQHLKSGDLTLLKRECKHGNRGIRYEIFNSATPFAEGGVGKIYLSEGVIKLVDSQLTFKKKQRAIKYQSTSKAQQEYLVSKDLPLLGMKAPVISDTGQMAYLVMRLFPGENLYEIIKKIKSGVIKVTSDRLIELTLNILQEIKAQVHNQNLVHRDIKSENIIVDLQTNAINLIDFEKSKKLLDPDHCPENGGTVITMPQEQFDPCKKEIPRYSIKADSYSVGKTLAELWHARPKVDIHAKTYPHIDHRIKSYLFYFSFASKDTEFDYQKFRAGDLSEKHAAQIKVTLEQLTRALPDNRWSIDQAIAVFQKIQEERRPEPNTRPKI